MSFKTHHDQPSHRSLKRLDPKMANPPRSILVSALLPQITRRSRDEDRPFWEEFIINRELLVEHLPGSIRYLHQTFDLGGFLSIPLGRRQTRPMLYDALYRICASLEESTYTNRVTLFESERRLLRNGSQDPPELTRIAQIVEHVCVALDYENGLGCSLAVVEHVFGFVEELLLHIGGKVGFRVMSGVATAFERLAYGVNNRELFERWVVMVRGVNPAFFRPGY